MAEQDSERVLDRPRVQPVVGAQDLHEVAAGDLQAAVEVREQARVDVGAPELEALVARVARGDLGRLVGGRVVEDDDLEIIVRLAQRALDGAR